ncbi:hypothetical protein CJF30_00006868 [Rutstroemia sp. NJR-2017a BBW]|nr:hypothetical protein CJF30_00006868 [Rutstroemia sp. NJR-2017a BBW]
MAEIIGVDDSHYLTPSMKQSSHRSHRCVAMRQIHKPAPPTAPKRIKVPRKLLNKPFSKHLNQYGKPASKQVSKHNRPASPRRMPYNKPKIAQASPSPPCREALPV